MKKHHLLTEIDNLKDTNQNLVQNEYVRQKEMRVLRKELELVKAELAYQKALSFRDLQRRKETEIQLETLTTENINLRAGFRCILRDPQSAITIAKETLLNSDIDSYLAKQYPEPEDYV